MGIHFIEFIECVSAQTQSNFASFGVDWNETRIYPLMSESDFQKGKTAHFFF